MLGVLAMQPARKRPGARLRLAPQLFHHYSDTRIACGPDGERFASINSDGRLKLWEIESGRLLDESLVSTSLEDVDLHPDGHRVACSTPGGDVFFYDLRKHELSEPVDPQLGGSLRLAFRPAGDLLAVGGSRVALLDATSSAVLVRAETSASALAWTPGGERLHAGGRDGKLRSLHGRSLRVLRSCQAHPDQVRAVAVSPDGTLIATGSEGTKVVALWDARTLEPRGQLRVGKTSVLALAFDPEGGELAAGGNDGVVRVFDMTTRRLARKSDELPSCVHGLAWSPDRRRLVVGICDGSVARLDASSLRPRRSPARHELAFAALCVARDEAWIGLVGCEQVCLWSPRSGKLRRLGELDDAGTVGAFSADGRLAVGTRGREVIVFSLASRRREGTLRLSGVPERMIWEGDAVIAKLEDGRIEAIDVLTKQPLLTRSRTFPDPRTLRLSSGAVLTLDDWERLQVQRPDGLSARLIVVEHGARLGLVAIDTEGHFDANHLGRSILRIGAGLPSAARSGSDETLGALLRPGLLLRTLTPAS